MNFLCYSLLTRTTNENHEHEKM